MGRKQLGHPMLCIPQSLAHSCVPNLELSIPDCFLLALSLQLS